ncbi:hypothetical protein NQ318_021110 [Aromia moschata]|uniref:Peptidase S1 domain-containing protein n=1 Tax=Aromia moschata TaxID=1265417 RepID=A0AAV8X7H1_9CUCU|nr:hypothetical protein NQ318_021110 [Aromia moschata]
MIVAKMFNKLVTVLAALTVSCQAVPVEIDIGARVVNGTDADIRDYPYTVSLQFNGRHTCGGSIIDPFNVLTAAHCVTRQLSSFTILYASSRLDDSNYNQRIIPLDRIIIHEGYTGRMPLYHDIAVLHLREPIPFGEGALPIRLPEPFSPTPENVPAILTGWGLEQTGGSVQNVLQMVEIEVYADAECEWRHNQTGPTSRLWNVCAGVQEGGKGQCNGDSGGPLVVNGIEVGIVSWSVKPCTVQGYPGVYVKVSGYVEWIRSRLKHF